MTILARYVIIFGRAICNGMGSVRENGTNLDGNALQRHISMRDRLEARKYWWQELDHILCAFL